MFELLLKELFDIFLDIFLIYFWLTKRQLFFLNQLQFLEEPFYFLYGPSKTNQTCIVNVCFWYSNYLGIKRNSKFKKKKLSENCLFYYMNLITSSYLKEISEFYY